MARVRLNLSLSLDGFVAGPDQSVANPLGVGGTRLHEWVIPLAAWRGPHGLEGGEVNASTPVVEEMLDGVGAYLGAIVPAAEECISYGMPAFRLNGRIVAGFAARAGARSYGS